MWTYEAERVVAAPPHDVKAALVAVAERVWGGRARLVVDSTTSGRVTAIDGWRRDEGPDVWLTWRAEAVDGGTRVRLALDEVDRGPDPDEGLQQVLDLVEQELAARYLR